MGASNVTLAVNVTLATGDALASQSCVASNDNVSSVKTTAPDIAVKLFESAVNTFDAAVVPAVIPSSNSSSASARTALPAVNAVPVIIPVEVIAPEPIVPAAVTFAPLKVNAVVVPDLIIRLADVLSKLPKVVPASYNQIRNYNRINF